MSSNTAFTMRLKETDIYWNVFYNYLRSFRMILLMMLGSALLIICMLWPYFSFISLLIQSALLGPGIFLLINIVFFPVVMVQAKQTLKKTLGGEVPIVFSQEDLYWKYKSGESRIRYDSLSKIFIYKRHIMFYMKPNFSLVIPWRDVPENLHDELMHILIQLKSQYNI